MMFQTLVWLMYVAPAFKWGARAVKTTEPQTVSSHVTLIAWSGANPGGRIRLPEREQRRRKTK